MTPQALKALRLELGITQKEMAENIGLELRMYQYIEKGKYELSKASAKLAEQIAKAQE
jgi:transcriptional regulator with XRE-family HTH domain